MLNAVASDDAQRLAALDPMRSFIVQAPAGSGKTELLIQRYLRLLAVVNEPEEIIAITFTRKAVAEMRGRVLQALREAVSGRLPASAHAQRTRNLSLAALARNQERDWALLDNPAGLRIQTIDSLCARLSYQMPLSSRFGAQLEPLDDADELYREAARALLAELEGENPWTPALEALVRHMDNDLGNLENLLAQMLARREQWLRHVAPGEPQSARREALERGFQNAICEALQDLAAQIPLELEAELVRLACCAAGNLKSSGVASAIMACDGLERMPGAESHDLQAWLGLAALLLTKAGRWRSRCGKITGFPARGADPAETARCEERKQAFAAVIGACRKQSNLLERLAALHALPAARYDDSQWQIMQALFDLLPVAAAQLELTFQARAEVDFSGVARRAQDALGSPEEPTDLALALDYRIRHLLVDEFQDTSQSQLCLLHGLTAGWQDGDGRTLFAVGDPMQSIYGFREAEVGVFLRVRQQGIGELKPQPLTLTANFRSQPGLVEWINEAFPHVFPAVENISAGAVAYTRCEAMHRGETRGAVQMHCFIGREQAAEAERVTELVARAREDDPDGTVAVLVRGKAHLLEIVPRLKAEGLSFRAVEIERLSNRPVVQDLLALTRALCHLADRLAWLAVLRAPWCGLLLHDLHALAGDDLQSPLWNLISDEDRCLRLSPDAQRRLARARTVLVASLKHRRRRSLCRRIEGTWLALGGPATITQPTDLDNARMYFELLERLDVGGDIIDFAALQAGVERLHAAPDTQADARVQIMTIHKAKGLEFDTVIVPGLGCAPRSEPRQLLAWLERINRAGDVDLLIAPIAASIEAEPHASYTAIRRLISAKTQHEDERLIYVAATRARRRLHLLGHARLNRDGECKAAAHSLLARLWPVVEADFAAAAAGEHQSPTAASRVHEIIPMIRRLAARWQRPAPPPCVAALEPPSSIDPVSPGVEFTWVGETARHVGVITHRLLQRVAREGLAQWNRARVQALRRVNTAALAALGVPASEVGDAATQIEQALLHTLESARGRWLFEASHRDTRAEYALTGVLEGRLVNIKIDRTFIDAMGARWVVDYKTGTHEGGDIDAFLRREEARYRPQLARYAALIGLIESQQIRAGLYYPLIENGWREWVIR